MFRAIYRDPHSRELVVVGSVIRAEIQERICEDGYDIILDFAEDLAPIIVDAGDRLRAEGILRSATISGLIDFTI